MDASGQMDHEDFPSSGTLGVPLRANSILQARVRVSQHAELEARRSGGTLKGLMFLHLKKDLDVQLLDWVNCQDPSVAGSNRVLTSYGIQKGVQRRLAAIRTDLDSFSDVEAFALMTSGYLMARTAPQGTGPGIRRGVLASELFQVAPTGRDLLLAAGGLVLSLSGFGVLNKVLKYRKTVREVAFGIGMATVGFLLARLHLHVFDRLFLRQGRLGRIRSRRARPEDPHPSPGSDGARAGATTMSHPGGST